MQISSADLFSTHGRTRHINEKSTTILPMAPASHHREQQGKLGQVMPWWRDHSILSLPVLRQQVVEERVCFLPLLVLLPFPRKNKKVFETKDRQQGQRKEGNHLKWKGWNFSSWMTTWPPSVWNAGAQVGGYSKCPQFHTPVTPQSCTAEFSNLNHIYMTELHYFYIVNTSI